MKYIGRDLVSHVKDYTATYSSGTYAVRFSRLRASFALQLTYKMAFGCLVLGHYRKTSFRTALHSHRLDNSPLFG